MNKQKRIQQGTITGINDPPKINSNITCIPKQVFIFQNEFHGISGLVDGTPMSSTIFRVNVGPNIKASFSLELESVNVHDQRCLTFHLKSHTPFPVRCRFKFTLLRKPSVEWWYPNVSTLNFGEQLGLNKLFKCDFSTNLLGPVENDSLNVKIDLIIFGEVQNSVGKKRNRERNTIGREVGMLMSSSSSNGLEKDLSISFSSSDDKLYAHSFILMLRSPVFRAMLSDRYQESITKEIKIEDIGFDCFKQILNYIYTDECELHENTFGLLNGSIKYCIEPLQWKIEDYLLEIINNENAALSLYYSDLYRAEYLKKKVLRYISRNKECINTDGFFEIINDVELQVETIKAVVESSCQVVSKMEKQDVSKTKIAQEETIKAAE